MKVLVVDVGGTHVKLRSSGRRLTVKIPSGPALTPRRLVRDVLAATQGWRYDVLTLGLPCPIVRGRPVGDPHNLGPGWRRFGYERAFGKPVRLINDAAMQALGSAAGGRMLFLGLGTGLGSALVDEGRVLPLELAHLPYRDGLSYEDHLGIRGLERMGLARWRHHVARVSEMLRVALVADHVVLGGGNVHRLRRMPPHCRRGDNDNAFRGGLRVWE